MFINNPGHMTKIHHAHICFKSFKNPLRDRLTDFNETWHVASMTRVLQYV